MTDMQVIAAICTGLAMGAVLVVAFGLMAWLGEHEDEEDRARRHATKKRLTHR